MKITDAIRNHVEKRVEGLSKIIDADDPTILVDVEVGKISNHHKSGDVFRAEINLRYNRKQYRAVSETGDMYGSVDEAQKQMMSELRRSKSKKKSSMKKGGAEIKRMSRQK